MEFEARVREVEKGLRDFQRATVDFVYERLFGAGGQRRMLVADDVGLGKTWIAKGVIAREYENVMKLGGDCLRVYYICSNQQLASQNLTKLNFSKDKACIVSNVNRISLLARRDNQQGKSLRISALTPDTSFSEKQGQGIKEERYIIYHILCSKGNFGDEESRRKLSSLLKGSNRGIIWHPEEDYSIDDVREDVADSYVEYISNLQVSRADAPATFERYAVGNTVSLYDLIGTVVEHYDEDWVEYSENSGHSLYQEVIGLLRKALTRVCVRLLDADIFIMDEFQRYSRLIEDTEKSVEEDESVSIAREVFGKKNAKILMLSATPFKAYTGSIQEQVNGESHYGEFKKVLTFLFGSDSEEVRIYERKRRSYFEKIIELRSSGKRGELLEELSALRGEIEALLSKVMVRTEKIIASGDPNAMIEERSQPFLQPQKADIEDFISQDRIFGNIYGSLGEKAPAPLDYAKSAPFAMSFLRDYKIYDKKSASAGAVVEKAFVKRRDINSYKFPKGGWPNAKLRRLMQGIDKEALLLWCPPSLCYYPGEGAFEKQERFTKTLVFSAWKLVPKMIATMLSYEAERQTLGRLKGKGIHYFYSENEDKRRKPSRRLVFHKSKNTMTTLMLAFPSRALARSVSPSAFAGSGKALKDIIDEVGSYWSREAENICARYGRADCEPHHAASLSVTAALLLERAFDNAWIERFDREAGRGKADAVADSMAFRELKKMLTSEDIPSGIPLETESKILGRQAGLMAKLALGAPGVCAYRALARYFSADPDLEKEAFRIGLAFIDLFNRPESIAVVDLCYNDGRDYWQRVVDYCIDGNLQAVLDEYVFMLGNDYARLGDVADVICNNLRMRSANLKIDDARSFSAGRGSKAEVRGDEEGGLSMRTHYASAFGVKANSSEGSELRAVSVREAFNSPFRPFVLATTSIGQEGLDFHWYCRRIVHWNLPDNPIDFEQREGRINRFRGKVIRQRIADRYKESEALRVACEKERFVRSGDEGRPSGPWESLFALAADEERGGDKATVRCDILPNWIYDSKGAGIERDVPLYSFSEDIDRYMNIRKVLACYRLTFGQPRQEELIEALDCSLDSEEQKRVMINLCPLCRKENLPEEPERGCPGE